MARKPKGYADLMRMAKQYGVEKNPLFVQCAEQLSALRETVAQIHRVLAKEDALLTSKEYVKGKENLCANPLLKELPRLTAEVNATARTMLDIIRTLGRQPEPEDELDDFLKC